MEFIEKLPEGASVNPKPCSTHHPWSSLVQVQRGSIVIKWKEGDGVLVKVLPCVIGELPSQFEGLHA